MARVTTLRPAGADYEIRIVGGKRRPLWDFYHALVNLSWTHTLLGIVVVFLLMNALFAFGYVETGGVAHAAAGSFLDAFFFSVQTLGTIGYGAMYPESRAANGVVVLESVTGFTMTALMTGLLFAKFSRPTARIAFTSQAVITPMNGAPTLVFRVGNERGNTIVDALIRVVLSRTEILPEGGIFYRQIDLKLARDHMLNLARAATVLHVIDETSPLHGCTPDTARQQEWELQILVVGLDETTMQTIHASYRYSAASIRWGARFADVLTEHPDGTLVLDLTHFDETVPSVPTKAFPYP